MGLKVESVAQGSLSDLAGLRPGDWILTVNGHTVDDVIDFQYHTADDVLDVEFEREGATHSIRITREDWSSLGLTFEPMQYASCGNHCMFCFIDQNPKGLRKTLYFKDEDYRLSFLHGNYVTLTRVNAAELQRIVSQQLSPLYISIHATALKVRKRLLGLKKDDGLMDKIRFLAEHGIEMHGQIVICPGFNDGDVLDKTLQDLVPFHPRLTSLAVVPVGLTRHRDELPNLRPVDANSARKVLDTLHHFQKFCLKKLGSRFVFGADELYLLSDIPLPDSEFYEEYPQIENGVGLVRAFLHDLGEAARSFPARAQETAPSFWILGKSAAPILEAEALPVFHQIQNLDLRIKAIPNRFFGESVTVTGLLTGQDIIHALKDETGPYRMLIPPVCLNTDGLFLDDLTPEDVSRALDRPVCILSEFEDFYE